MRGNLSIIVLTLLLVGGCRGWPRPAALPDAYHIRVGQLHIHSDFELTEDNRILRDLTTERENICRTLGLPPGHEVIDVHLFRDGERYAEFLARHFPGVPSRRAFFLETDARLAVYAHWSDRMAEDLRHEVAHGYLHAVVPGIPLWLDEGLAEFFEVPQNLNGFNQPHLALLSDMMQHDGWKPDLARLERLRDATQMDQRDYAESWAWVYAMLHSNPEQREVLTNYLADIHQGRAVEPLSRRLAALSAEPEQTLSKYLAGLKQNTTVR
ncbi:MAG: DUF1570 domain-containing protein [Planctomycetes bacterium]|nr:DUF1570 domain-containing protein [Planctomycetota bacterium]